MPPLPSADSTGSCQEQRSAGPALTWHAGRLASVALIGSMVVLGALGSRQAAGAEPVSALLPSRRAPAVLAGTTPLELPEPLSAAIIRGTDRHVSQLLAQSVLERQKLWQRDLTSPSNYQRSVAGNRERFRQLLGVVDPRVPRPTIEDLSMTRLSGLDTPGTRTPDPGRNDETYSILPVRWPVVRGVWAEGLALLPRNNNFAGLVVAIPDAQWTPEEFCGADAERPEASPMPRWLASQGYLVVIPTLLSREETFSGSVEVQLTNQSHREWIYRPAFVIGRHVIGYEVQEILAAVDGLTQLAAEVEKDLPILVAGVGEGGLLALASAALDSRIEAVLVSGYFGPREAVWSEPIERNVWRLLTEFGDAEVASLIAPRPLILEAAHTPTGSFPWPLKPGRHPGAAPGTLQSVPYAALLSEVERVRPIYAQLMAETSLIVIPPADTAETDQVETANRSPAAAPEVRSVVDHRPGGTAACAALVTAVNRTEPLEPISARLMAPVLADASERQRRLVEQWSEFTQDLVRASQTERKKRWAVAEPATAESWPATRESLTQMVWDQMFGRLPEPTAAPAPRSRKLREVAEYTAYEVALDVFPDVMSGGVLLLPGTLSPGEKRPLVVCHLDADDTPASAPLTSGLTSGPTSAWVPNGPAVELCRQGFVVYVPHDLVPSEERRRLSRKCHPLGLTPTSYLLAQERVALRWLSQLPMVDATRIACFGAGSGGRTALRLPTLLDEYRTTLCAGEFTDEVLQLTSLQTPGSAVFGPDYDRFEWNLAHVASSAELATLLAPRRFLVARDHDDPATRDEWVASEFARVQRHYARLGASEQVGIRYFSGGTAASPLPPIDFLGQSLQAVPSP